MSTPGPDDDLRICAVCGRPLDTYTPPGGGEPRWMHTLSQLLDEDHPAVPVRPGEVPTVGRCDFCGEPGPQFELPAGDFIVEAAVELVVDGFLADQASRGNWSACPPCAELVAADRWGALVRRCAAVFEATVGRPMPDEAREHTGRLFLTLRRHVTGPVRPMPRVDPPSR